jgi:malate dehydrogenase (oxaloacetate-decarboxylating)(NADP+)
MFERNYFGMMMVETGEADAMITGVFSKYADTIEIAKEVIGIREGLNHIGAMHIVNTKKGMLFLADTLFNRHPDTDTLIDIARLADATVKFFNHDPVIAMVSYSNFGSDSVGSPASVHQVVKTLHERYPEMVVDGEMQVNYALNKELRDKKYPFTRLRDKEVNTLVFPNLSSANASYKILKETGKNDIIGPIQMGLNKPVHILDVDTSVRDIVNMVAVAVIDAIVEENIRLNNLSRII